MFLQRSPCLPSAALEILSSEKREKRKTFLLWVFCRAALIFFFKTFFWITYAIEVLFPSSVASFFLSRIDSRKTSLHPRDPHWRLSPISTESCSKMIFLSAPHYAFPDEGNPATVGLGKTDCPKWGSLSRTLVHNCGKHRAADR